MSIEETKKSAEELKEIFKSIPEELIILDNSLAGVGAKIESELNSKIKGATKSVKDFAEGFQKDLSKSITNSQKGLDKFSEIQLKINKGQDASKEIAKKRNDLIKEREKQQRKIEVLRREGIEISEIAKFQLDEYYQKELEIIDAQEEINQKQKDQIGIVGKLGKAISGVLNKLGLGAFEGFFQFEESIEKANVKIAKLDLGDGVQDNFKKSGIVAGELAKNIDQTAIASAALFSASKALFDLAIKTSDKITTLSRDLNISVKEAKELKNQFREASLGAGLFGITIEDQIEAIGELNEGLGGTALTFDKETNAAAAETLKRLRLSGEAVSNINKLALVSGKTFKEIEQTQIGTSVAVQNELGIRLDTRKVLEEANTITGQTRINLDKFPGGLVKAVAVAKSLGVEMDALAGATSQLLDFQTSIENEMEAELLLGRELNLEAARQAALVGDQEGLMRELVREAGSLEELQGMTVLQQNALAAALGLSADQLANQVLNGEALATQKDEQLAKEKAAEEAQLKALTASQMQATAMKKLADLFSIAVPILVGLAAAAAAAAVALTLGAGAPFISAGILKTGLAVGAGVGLAAGAATAAIGDGTLPPGGPYSITDTSKPFGSTVITTKGDGIAVSPNINQTNGDDKSAKELMEMKNILKSIAKRPEPKINMDSIQVGTVAGLSAFPIQ